MSGTFSENKTVPNTFFQLQAMETGYRSESEAKLLRDALALTLNATDPLELPNYRTPRAHLNAYRHRLQALRRDYVNVRLRVLEVEEQLTEARSLIEQMRASRGWKIVEQYRRWRRSISRCFQSLRGLAGVNTSPAYSPKNEAHG